MDSFDSDTNLTTLHAVRGDLERPAAEGARLLDALVVAFTQKADEMGQRLVRRLSELERSLLANREVLKLWMADDMVQHLFPAIDEARRLLAAEEYGPLKALLDGLEKQVAERSTQAQELEEKQQRRLYLLKAVRQVCAEMGFCEISLPHYQREGDRGSPISFSVDTLDRGRIQFTLSLEAISSFSEIADDRCFEEFSELSRYLSEQFGISTRSSVSTLKLIGLPRSPSRW
ncbi:MAG TPA: hypothetical protein VHS06_06325 [Chloroflexota bacterium]|nr:hypothetical protein [Chloroflexota bacterium]